MATNQLQLQLLPNPEEEIQQLPADVVDQSIVLIARMLLHLVSPERAKMARAEVDNECR